MESTDQPARGGWRSFWALVAMQIAQSFNVNAAKFILMALGAWLIERKMAPKGVEHLVTVMLVLPYVIFAPTCGWLSDRFAKTAVIQWTSWLQIVALAFTGWSIHAGHLMWAIGGFFLISTQAALLSPSKVGVVKELVGGSKLGFASGVMEGTVILAILAGQIIGGTWFDARLGPEMGGYAAALTPFYWLLLIAAVSVGLSYFIKPSAKHPGVPWSIQLATRHISDLREIFSAVQLKLCGLGVAFFWGFGGFIALIVLQVAEQVNGGGGKGTGTTFAQLWTMAVIGIAIGSVGAGIISRKRIEMGLAPLGALVMTAGTLALAFSPLDSFWQKLMLVIAGAGGAVFLVPLQAVLQDAPAEDRRGTVLSASGLLNNLSGICFTALQFGLKYSGASIGFQFATLAVLTTAVTWLALRHLLVDLIRLVGLAVIRAVYRIHVSGLSHVPEKGGVLLLPNHITYADAFFLTAACPRRVRFVMDVAFMSNRWVRGFAKIFKTVAIDRSNPREAIRITIAALQEGDVVCLFPEGQITRSGSLVTLERGFELIAKKAGCPIVPVWTAGAWGSIFSYERGRLFSKWPYRIPHRLAVSFGLAIDTHAANIGSIREGLRTASAAASAAYFPDGQASAAILNGHQLSQINALPHQQPFHALDGDPVIRELAAVLAGFSSLVRSPQVIRSTLDTAGTWIGGYALRQALRPLGNPPLDFYDLSPQALEAPKVDGIRHFPCLAIDGIIIAMSMADPTLIVGSPPQPGKKAGSWGKLLPGFYLLPGAPGQLRVHGPSTPTDGLLLPLGTSLDDEGFLLAPAPQT
jgi:acyl-[acyl-carrier-protein]-phospholipid O-acyltransferase / long-chain-fatty-acid--[acyl-carrier-protein] ligase